MTGISASKLILIFAIALVVFGGKRLPEVATSLGQALNNFRQALRGKEKGPDKLALKKEN